MGLNRIQIKYKGSWILVELPKSNKQERLLVWSSHLGICFLGGLTYWTLW